MHLSLLQSKLATTLCALSSKCQSESTSEGSGINEQFCRSIDTEVKEILKKQERNKFVRALEANQDQGDILQRYRRIESFFRQIQVST